MEGPEIGLAEAIQEAQELRRATGAKDIVVHWTTEFGDISLIAGEDGHDLFAGGEPVPTHGREN